MIAIYIIDVINVLNRQNLLKFNRFQCYFNEIIVRIFVLNYKSI